MTSTYHLRNALNAMHAGVSRLLADDPDLPLKVATDLPEEAAAVKAEIVKLGRAVREADALAKMAREMARDTAERARRFENRSEQIKGVVLAALDALGERKIEAPDITVSLRAGGQSVLVTDEAKIPDEYWKIERTLSKSALADDLKQGVIVEGAALANGLPSVTIRSK